jgi:hypothetical protein
MKTTETVAERALYSSECCAVQVTFNEGDTFTRCPNCQHLCIWELEEDAVNAENVPDSDNGVAA